MVTYDGRFEVQTLVSMHGARFELAWVCSTTAVFIAVGIP